MARRSTLRASDADRERVAERLRQATVEGRLVADELEERLARVLRARTYGELDALVRDLPRGVTPAPRRRPSLARAGAQGLAVAVVGVVALAMAAAVVVTLAVLAALFAAVTVILWALGGRRPRRTWRHHYASARRGYLHAQRGYRYARTGYGYARRSYANAQRMRRRAYGPYRA